METLVFVALCFGPAFLIAIAASFRKRAYPSLVAWTWAAFLFGGVLLFGLGRERLTVDHITGMMVAGAGYTALAVAALVLSRPKEYVADESNIVEDDAT